MTHNMLRPNPDVDGSVGSPYSKNGGLKELDQR